jgi:hypothetical protein
MHPLTQALQHSPLALFIGGDLPQAVTGVPSRAALAQALAQRHGLDAGASLARVAQQVGRGGWRREFTVFLREQLQGARPQPFHQGVVDVVREYDVKIIVTTAYDDLLRRAFEDDGVPVEVVWKDAQLAVAFQDRPLIIKLYGDPLADVESLVVTEDDHLDLARDRAREDMLDEVKRALQRHTVLFLGYDLSDPDFRLLWREVLSRAGDLHRRAFAVWPGLPEAEVEVWADRGIVIMDADPWGLVEGGGLEPPPGTGAASPEPKPCSTSSSPRTGTDPDVNTQSSHKSEDFMPETPSIPSHLYQRLQTVLLRCGPRDSQTLRPMFVDSRISQWRDMVPARDNPAEHVQAVIDTLWSRANAAGENALVLLLDVLRDRTPRGDACYEDLNAVARKLEGLHNAGVEGGGVSPVPPSGPLKGPLSARVKRNLIQALLVCPTISDRHTRDTVVSELPADVRSNIRRNTVDRVDVSNIVTACMNYEGGLQALIESVRFYEGNSIPRQNLDALWRNYSD